MKLKSVKKWGQYVILVLFIGLLFTSELRAEVFGFFQRGLMELGFFQPTIEKVEKGAAEKNPAQPAEDTYKLKLTNQNGEVVKLSELRGKVVFMNFWASWCKPCVVEMPSINKLYQDYKNDEKVVFLMVNMDRSFARGKQFVKNKGYDFNIHRVKGSAPQVFQPRSIPTTFVLNKKGEIHLTHTGMANYNTPEFRKMLNKLKKK